MFTGKQRRRSEVNSLGGGAGAEFEEEQEGGRRPQRRAAKNLAKNVYSVGVEEDLEFADSPASTETSSAKDTPPVEVTLSRRRGWGGARRGKGRGGRGKGRRKGNSMKVPPMKIKLIGRTGVSDSPIFFAESLGEVSYFNIFSYTLQTLLFKLYTPPFSLSISLSSGRRAQGVRG